MLISGGSIGFLLGYSSISNGIWLITPGFEFLVCIALRFTPGFLTEERGAVGGSDFLMKWHFLVLEISQHHLIFDVYVN